MNKIDRAVQALVEISTDLDLATAELMAESSAKMEMADELVSKATKCNEEAKRAARISKRIQRLVK